MRRPPRYTNCTGARLSLELAEKELQVFPHNGGRNLVAEQARDAEAGYRGVGCSFRSGHG